MKRQELYIVELGQPPAKPAPAAKPEAHQRTSIPELESIREIGPGLKELATAVKTFPAETAVQLQAVERAYQAGFGSGAFIGVIAGLVIAWVFAKLLSLWSVPP